MTIEEILKEIEKDKLTPMLEIACYCETDDEIPQYLQEFDTEHEVFDFCKALINDIFNPRGFKRIEITINGTQDGYNETCYNIKDILIKGD